MEPRHSGVYPVIYRSQYTGQDWQESYTEYPHHSYEEEQTLSSQDLHEGMSGRNWLDIPVLSGTLHYSVSAFEGGKAFPQPDGSIKIFRAQSNAKRFIRSLEGLYIPHPTEQNIFDAISKTVGKNVAIGFYPRYDKSFEASDFFGAPSMYIRPFVIGESNLTPASCEHPTVMVICLPIGSFFKAKTIQLSTSHRSRAVKGGIGWIKAAANYTISAIGRKEAQLKGYSDALFLDHEEKKYVEESSATNFFCVLKSGEIVTPALGDTILPGITRDSILCLAKSLGLTLNERLLPIQEVMDNAAECFVCGTGGGVIGVSAIEYNGRVSEFCDAQEPGEITSLLGGKLRGIQFGREKDIYNWMSNPIV